MVYDQVGGSHSPLAIRVFGNDFTELRRIAAQIVDILTPIRGTAEASIFQEPPIPQMTITADRAAAARYGINVQDIMNLIQIGIGGAPVTQVYDRDRQYNVTVRFAQAGRHDPASIGSLVLTSATGAQVPISQVADIRLSTGESSISHEGNERQLTVRIDLRDRDLASYLAEAQSAIQAGVKLDPAKYRIEYAGQFKTSVAPRHAWSSSSPPCWRRCSCYFTPASARCATRC